MANQDKDLTRLFVRDLDDIPLPPRDKWRPAPRKESQLMKSSRYALYAGAIAAVLVIALIASFQLRDSNQVAASPSPTASTTTSPAPTTASSSPTPSAAASPLLCDSYQTGDTPIVAPRLSGRWMRVALDAVRPGPGGHNRWALRLMVGSDAPANAEVRLNAAVTGPNGALETFGYSAGPPNAGDATVQQPIILAPCGSRPAVGVASGVVVLTVETSPVTSGTYAITLRDLKRPEGDTVNELWTVVLTCTLDPGPARPQATNCK